MEQLKWDGLQLDELMDLKPAGDDRFIAIRNEANAYGILFGGQLMGQALAAADATIATGAAHGLNVHFVNAGDPSSPVAYAVERLRDGGRSALRRVNATQAGKLLMTAMVSYREPQNGFEHQLGPSAAGGSDSALDISDLARERGAALPAYLARHAEPQAFDIRIPSEEGFLQPADTLRRHYWLRASRLPSRDDEAMHRRVIAYLSDVLLAGASLTPHTIPLPGAHVRSITTSQALWFHRQIRSDDWLLFETDSPSAAQGETVARGLIYDAAGRLGASVVQEALQQPVR